MHLRMLPDAPILHLQSFSTPASMATDPYLLERMRNIMQTHNVPWFDKRMFGGNCFMVDDKMCFGTFKGGLMVRVDPEEFEALIVRPGTEQMVQNGREMKGYLWVAPEGYDLDEDLEFWINKCLEFNPKAKASKKRRKR